MSPAGVVDVTGLWSMYWTILVTTAPLHAKLTASTCDTTVCFFVFEKCVGSKIHQLGNISAPFHSREQYLLLEPLWAQLPARMFSCTPNEPYEPTF